MIGPNAKPIFNSLPLGRPSDVSRSRHNHAENFHLADFVSLNGADVVERAQVFQDVIANYINPDNPVWAKVLDGPSQSLVQVHNGKRPEIMVGSNNYLGFANDPQIVAAVVAAINTYGVGAGGPPLLSGTLAIHKELETRLAALKQTESCMLFASGYQANIGWISACLRKHDYLIYDEQSHASFFDGMTLQRNWARFESRHFRHNDMAHLRERLHKARAECAENGAIYVCCEGVYSMVGDLAPLGEILDLCGEFDAYLIIDDAHGTGVMGQSGAGTLEHYGIDSHPRLLLQLGTFSKAFGTAGGFLVGSKAVIDYMRFFARSYMFSAHLPPPVVATVIAGLDLLASEPERISQLHNNVRYLISRLNEEGFGLSSESAIVAVPVPRDVPIRELVARFHELGVFLNCIEPPAVAPSEQKLRISLMATLTHEQLDHVIAAAVTLGKEYGLIAAKDRPSQMESYAFTFQN